MSLPVGFYAIHQAADLLQRPTDRVFVRARYVCPIEQVLPGSYPFEHFPRLVLWGGPTTRDMDARYQQNHARACGVTPEAGRHRPEGVERLWHLVLPSARLPGCGWPPGVALAR